MVERGGVGGGGGAGGILIVVLFSKYCVSSLSIGSFLRGTPIIRTMTLS